MDRRQGGTGGRRWSAALAGPGAVVAVARRPWLWLTALHVVAGVLEPGWWRRWPPRPTVPADYLAWRRHTMWGDDETARLGPEELVGYLAWCRRARRR